MQSSSNSRRPFFAQNYPARRALVLVLAPIVALVMGCAGEESPRPTAVAPPLSPEERFDNFTAALRRQFDNDVFPSSTVADLNVEAGVPVTKSRTTVEHELIVPEKEGDPYRGVVTITTLSTVTVVLPLKTKEEVQEKGNVGAEEEATGEGAGSLVRTPGGGVVNRLGSSPIQTLPNENVTQLDLEYRDGKWVLLTDIDEENEPFTATSVEYALRRQ